MPEPPADDEASAEAEAEAERYIQGLIARGEAAEPDEDGELPDGATHEIYKDAKGRRRVRRRRFY